MMHLLLFVLALSAAPAPQVPPATAPDASQATAGTQAAATPAPDAEDSEDRVVCRRERIVGSNRPQRTCMTRRQWQAAADATKENLRDLRPNTEELSSGR